MTKTSEVLERSREAKPQTKFQIMRGLDVRRTKGGIPVVSLHYTADPNRDPEVTPEWKLKARKGYTSQAAWDREQEIVDNAGGGELVFADTLITYWNKIVITSPDWRPDPRWKVIGGFDHGKTNPTCLERCYIDHDGNKYFCGEYYVPGKNVWEHAPEILKMPDIERFEACWTDPSVFDQQTQQEQGKQAKAVADLYLDEGVTFLTRFGGNRNDQTFAERLLLHWKNLDERQPRLFIVCRNDSEQPQPGLHPWDSPNLLWELMRTRREKLSAQQLLTQNLSERIVDKDNHARDCTKQILMSLPEPTEYTQNEKVFHAMKPHLDAGDLTNAHLAAERTRKKLEEEDMVQYAGASARQRMAIMSRRRGY